MKEPENDDDDDDGSPKPEAIEYYCFMEERRR